MKDGFRRDGGFTIIEMMIVILVIIVLSGMVFKLMGLAGAKNEEAETKAKLHKLANAVEEYRAIYGKYPPVYNYPSEGQPVRYEYANLAYLKADAKADNYSGNPAAILRAQDGTGRDLWVDGTQLFTFGLLSYFVPRYKGFADGAPEEFVGGKGDEDYNSKKTIHQWRSHNERTGKNRPRMSEFDRQENIDSSRKILPYLDAALDKDGKITSWGILESGPTRFREFRESKNHPVIFTYRNLHITVKDGWGNEIRYQSNPPHDTYKLWSVGPDGASGTRDDIVLTGE